jgi:adenylosuccinate lyase
MKKNLDMGGGLVYSGQLLLELAATGVLRETAYRWVQRNALRAWEEESSFRELVGKDPDISAALTPEQIDAAFTLKHQLRHVDQIFARVFA